MKKERGGDERVGFRSKEKGRGKKEREGSERRDRKDKRKYPKNHGGKGFNDEIRYAIVYPDNEKMNLEYVDLK